MNNTKETKLLPGDFTDVVLESFPPSVDAEEFAQYPFPQWKRLANAIWTKATRGMKSWEDIWMGISGVLDEELRSDDKKLVREAQHYTPYITQLFLDLQGLAVKDQSHILDIDALRTLDPTSLASTYLDKPLTVGRL